MSSDRHEVQSEKQHNEMAVSSHQTSCESILKDKQHGAWDNYFTTFGQLAWVLTTCKEVQLKWKCSHQKKKEGVSLVYQRTEMVLTNKRKPKWSGPSLRSYHTLVGGTYRWHMKDDAIILVSCNFSERNVQKISMCSFFILKACTWLWTHSKFC